MKTLPLLLVVVVVAILAALAAKKASFPIKRSNNSSTLSDLKLLTSQTILLSYFGVFYVQLGMGTPSIQATMAFSQPRKLVAYPIVQTLLSGSGRRAHRHYG